MMLNNFCVFLYPNTPNFTRHKFLDLSVYLFFKENEINFNIPNFCPPEYFILSVLFCNSFLLIQSSVCYLRIFCAYIITSLKCFVDNVNGSLLIYTYMGNTNISTNEFSHVSICFIISTNNTNIKFSAWYLRFNDISPGVDGLLRAGVCRPCGTIELKVTSCNFSLCRRIEKICVDRQLLRYS